MAAAGPRSRRHRQLRCRIPRGPLQPGPDAFLRTGVFGVNALLEAARLERDRRGERVRMLQVSTDEGHGPKYTGLVGRDRPDEPDQPGPRPPRLPASTS